MITRRTAIKGLAGSTLGAVGLSGYAVAVEPMRGPMITSYAVQPPRWPAGLKLKIAALADIHACEPWMGPRRIEHICDITNRLGADLIVLLGDYTTAHRYVSGQVAARTWAGILGQLKAPLGTWSILGNHDWWSDADALWRGEGPTEARVELERSGVRVLENDVARLSKGGVPFWLAGLGDQIALVRSRLSPRSRRARELATAELRLGPGNAASTASPGRRFIGVDDLPGTLAKITDDAPVVLLAHEPDIFTSVPDRVGLTLAGHTHGGQVRVLGWSPIVPSRYRNRFAYGLAREGERSIVVSGGLGCSVMPIRFGVPPEIVVIDVGV